MTTLAKADAGADDPTARIPLLAILDITDVRTYDPDYEAVRNELTARIVTRTRECGWAARVVYADKADLPVLRAEVADADALLVAGGEDVDPVLYGAARGYLREGHHFPRADANQIELVKEAVAGGVPVLGICRGLQVINVALGGTLTTDLGESTMHRDYDSIRDAFVEHPVSLDPGAPIAAELGESIVCVSAHHQAVDRLGDGLVPIATAPDGIVEAVRHRSAPVLAVQWHPETEMADPSQFPVLLRAAAAVLAV